MDFAPDELREMPLTFPKTESPEYLASLLAEYGREMSILRERIKRPELPAVKQCRRLKRLMTLENRCVPHVRGLLRQRFPHQSIQPSLAATQ